MFATRSQMELINDDRRDDRRYPIELEMRYKVVARNRAQLHGTGRTMNMSSGGVLFDGDQSLPAGTFVELSINWPVLLQEARRPLTLMILGRVVRCDGNAIAVKMNRYEFMTRPVRKQDDLMTGPMGNTYIA